MADDTLWIAARVKVMTDIDNVNREIKAAEKLRNSLGYSYRYSKTPEHSELLVRKANLQAYLNEMSFAMWREEDYILWKLSYSG